MILYQALSSYQILECIVHRMTIHPGERAVLLLGNYIVERMPQYREARSRGFFDEVFLFRYGGYKGNEEQILREVGEEFARTVPYPIGDFSRIYAAGIHTFLQVLWARDHIPFAMFEDGSGALSRPWILSDIHRKSSPRRWKLVEKYHLYDHSSPSITRKICDKSSQLPGFYDEKAEDFQVVERFEALPRETAMQIREFFRLPFYTGCQDRVLLLTQQFANLGQLSLREQIVIYQNLMDYYLEGEDVLIKPHPDDILYYGLLFPQAQVMRELFPSELLPLAFDALPRKVCTISSTGINLIRKDFGQCLAFNAAYEHTFHFNHLYYMALRTALSLGFSSVWAVGLNMVQLSNLAECSGGIREKAEEGRLQISDKLEELSGDVICLLDDGLGERDPDTASPAEEGGGQECVLPWTLPPGVKAVLYLNTEGNYGIYSYERKREFSSMIPLVVEKKQISRKEYWDTESRDAMYLYTREERIRNMSRKLTESRELPLTGTKISFARMTDEQIRIQMLEGILAATEKRLLEYVRSEKALKEQLAQYQKE